MPTGAGPHTAAHQQEPEARMYIILYIVGGFLLVFGLGSLVVQDPLTGLIFIGILVLVTVIASALIRADEQKPPDESP